MGNIILRELELGLRTQTMNKEKRIKIKLKALSNLAGMFKVNDGHYQKKIKDYRFVAKSA